jgi:glycine/D-amino acid oxidase-like deaminating enzyme
MPGLALLAPTAVRALSPAVPTDRLLGGLFSPHEINVDPRKAIAGLRAYLTRDPASS